MWAGEPRPCDVLHGLRQSPQACTARGRAYPTARNGRTQGPGWYRVLGQASVGWADAWRGASAGSHRAANPEAARTRSAGQRPPEARRSRFRVCSKTTSKRGQRLLTLRRAQPRSQPLLPLVWRHASQLEARDRAARRRHFVTAARRQRARPVQPLQRQQPTGHALLPVLRRSSGYGKRAARRS